MSGIEILNALLDARREWRAARLAVRAWMDEQGREGNLVHAGCAPGWEAYEAAEVRWTAALAELDRHIEKETP